MSKMSLMLPLRVGQLFSEILYAQSSCLVTCVPLWWHILLPLNI